MKKIVILGSTGSIGTNVLNVMRHLGPLQFKLMGLAAHSNIDLLFKQAQEFHPEIIGVFDKDKALELQKRLPHIRVVGGLEGLLEVSSLEDNDLVFNSIVGMDGLQPMMAAIEAGKTIALANKEVLVSAGKVIMDAAKEKGCDILPVDSEHNAIFQCLQGQTVESVRRIILTASGGPFLHHPFEKLKEVTLKEALNHPNWKMGAKITVDSSTLMNKGFEVIETHWLFDIPIDKIDVVIHPQSIIHSMVEFIDNSTLAQMGAPEMLTPIQLALTYPKKYPGMLAPLDFTKIGRLDFIAPDTKRFNCLKLAYDALKEGDSLPCYLNAINETLVERFLKKEISWYDIPSKLQKLMDTHKKEKLNTIDDILFLDQKARKEGVQV
ncbi:MAG: 1-deoxy-D-xylulose 5-phosphate reductoisomerase [Chlamydiae bacterium]|nr:1-deoxy-D-xylulose 5-phosphate reductoisomerase [Chlamydiota bacterium]